MRSCSLLLALTLTLALFVPRAQAQDAPMKWGKVDQQDFNLREFPIDTNAVAVVLADYGVAKFSNSGDEITFERHRRVKILSEAAYDDWGTFSFTYYHKDGLESMSRVEGQTFVLQNGRVQQTKLDKKSIFKEDVNGFITRVRFTLPALEPGAIIEYRYKIVTESIANMPDWDFQTDEPTLWSEFRIEHPIEVQYVYAEYGMRNYEYEVKEENDVNRPNGSWKQFRWAVKDLPALRSESFMTTPRDYLARLDVQLYAYMRRGYGMVPTLASWDELGKELLDDYRFGQKLDPSGDVRRKTEEITAGLTTPEEKVAAIHRFVSTDITWDDTYGWFSERSLDEVMKTKSGDVHDINMLMIAMIRAAGFQADPVLISTRGRGAPQEMFPLRNQFNYIIARARVGRNVLLLDATDPYQPMDMLPYNVLNGRGWLVTASPQWIDVASSQKFRRFISAQVELAEDGMMSGTLEVAHAGYSARSQRESFQSLGQEEYFKRNFKSIFDEVNVDNFTIENLDDLDASLKFGVTLSNVSAGQAAGDFIYFNPVLYGKWEENPLKNPARTFPVDFAYPYDYNYTLELKLPEGFEVAETPQNVRTNLPNRGGVYQRFYQYDAATNVLKMTSRLSIAKAWYDVREYRDLRDLYAKAVSGDEEQVVLKRATGVIADTEDAGDGR